MPPKIPGECSLYRGSPHPPRFRTLCLLNSVKTPQRRDCRDSRRVREGILQLLKLIHHPDKWQLAFWRLFC